MPDRIIRESALLSPTLERLSAEAERLFWRLTLVADDYGRFDADPRAVVSRALPLLAPRIALKDAAVWLAELIEAGLLAVYHVGERCIASFRTWSKYQRTRESRPKFPSPNEGEAFDTMQYLNWANGSYPQYPQALAARARVFEGRETWVESRESLTTESRETRVEGREPTREPRDAATALVPPARPARVPDRSAVADQDRTGDDDPPRDRIAARSRQTKGTPEHLGAGVGAFMATLRQLAVPPPESIPRPGEAEV